MFFDLKLYNTTNDRISFSSKTLVDSSNRKYKQYIDDVFRKKLLFGNGDIEQVDFVCGFPDSVKKKTANYRPKIKNQEEYAIAVDKKTKIYAHTEEGFLYAIATLVMLCREKELYRGFIYDYPLCETRGYRVYLPSREGIEDFFKIVDFLAEYKFNSIMLEIGGAMEYERHPEINKAWSAFCEDVKRYSGRAHEIQNGMYPWRKNSIHCNNAEGDILTKDECRRIADYCRSRGMEVIPECPSLSHTDFLVMAHPELKEREGDMYPDTYCPNHPDVYGYVFDILEEVIEVFAPKKINIGHDETYSIGICPRCKNTPAPVLYANDVKKIHAFLSEKGIKTVMWGEKLLNARRVPGSGDPIGGAASGKGLARVPALYPARDLLPRDIEILHWYYVFNPKYDNVYLERGFRTVYGNLNAMNVVNWNERIENGVKGGFVSNWGSCGDEYMQRNLNYLAIIATSFAFWCPRYGKMSKEESLYYFMKEAYKNKASKIKNPITVTHTTDCDIKYKCFYDGVFIVDSEYMLGHYKLTYTDGNVAELPVKYGLNITNMRCRNYLTSASFREISYSSVPVRYRDGFAYETIYENPYPASSVKKIEYVPCAGKENVNVELLSFSLSINEKKLSVNAEGIAASEFAWDGSAKDQE